MTNYYNSTFKRKPTKPLKKSGFKRKPYKVGFYAKPKRPINLHRKAWDKFSKWIRERDKICITCGNRGNLEAGHFWHGVLDFDEMNINAQCKSCNHFKSGNLAIYSVYLINKYGLEKFKDLEKRHYIAMRGEYRTDKDYQNLITKYE